MKKYGVELFRFLMAIVICLHHFRLYSDALPYGGGYLAVDFFFILSGLFLYRHGKYSYADSIKAGLGNTIEYIWRRYKRLYIPYIIALMLYVIIYFFIGNLNLGIGSIKELILKFTMMDALYVENQLPIIPQGWYCSSLIISSGIVYFGYSFFRDKFAKFISPVLAAGIYVFFLKKYGNLNLYSQYGFGLTVGTYRAIAGLCLGCFLGFIIDSHPNMYFNLKWFHVISFFTVVGSVFYTLLWKNGYDEGDFLLPIAFAILIYYLIKENCISGILSRSAFSLLGDLSYILFLMHYVIAVLFDKYSWLREYNWKTSSMIYLIAVFCVSVGVKQFTVKVNIRNNKV